MNQKWLVLLLVVFCLLPGSLVPAKSVTVPAWSARKMAVSEEYLYVLHCEDRLVRIYTSQTKEIGQFRIYPPLSKAPPQTVDIACDGKMVYVLDAEYCEVWCYSLKGEYLQNIPMISRLLVSPRALYCYEEYLLIADARYLWVMDEQGHIRQNMLLPIDRNGIPIVVSDITSYQETIYLLDRKSGCLYKNVMPLGLFIGELSYNFYQSLGDFGQEPGRFLCPSGVCAIGDWIGVADKMKGTITGLHKYTEEVYLIPDTITENKHPSDVMIWDNQFWISFMESDPLYSMILVQEPPKISWSPDHLDFGSNSESLLNFLFVTLFSESGQPFSGELSVDNPHFSLSTNRIDQQTRAHIRVEFLLEQITQETIETGSIIFTPDRGEKIVIRVKGRTAKQNDLMIFTQQLPDLVSLQHELPVFLKPQNFLSAPIECTFGKTDIPFLLSWKKRVIYPESEEENTIVLSPRESYVAPGYYTIPIIVKCPEEKLIRQLSITFCYRGMAKKVPGTILGEYFSADWCCYCPSVLKSFPELHQKYTTDQINFLAYYNDCVEEDPKRLCFPEAESRMKSYNPIGMHRIMVMNGIHKLDKAYNDGKTTMTKEYDEFIQQISPMTSPISLSGFAKRMDGSQEILIGATVQCLQEMYWKQPRLFCVIAENGIEFKAKNGLGIHHYVVRDFISLPNPENDEAYGTPLLSKNGGILSDQDDLWQGHFQVSLDEKINLDNAFCVLIVQDMETKQVFQSRYVPFQPAHYESIGWLTERKSVQLRQNQHTSFCTWLINQGDQINRFEIEIFNRKPFHGRDAWKVNGVRYPISETVTVIANPMETVPVEFSLPPDWGEPEPPYLHLRAIRKGDAEEKAIYLIVPVQRASENRFSVLYPDESILSEAGWKTDQRYSPCILETEPETVMEILSSNESITADRNGILTLPLGKCYGIEKQTIRVTYPDQSTETFTLTVNRIVMIKLRIGDSLVQINQEFERIEAAPYIRNGRTMVPMRIITENLCCEPKLSYYVSLKQITLKTEELEIIVRIGLDYAMVNGKKVPLDAPPELVNDRTFLPLRFFAEVLGAVVNWDGKTQEITITR